MRILLPTFIAAFLTSSIGLCAGKTTARLEECLQTAGAADKVIAWVFFGNKGTEEALKANVPRSVVSQRSLLRRQKVRDGGEVVDYSDLPVEASFVETLSALGARVRQRSRWFNAASISATPAQLRCIEELPFVAKVDLVWRARRNPEPEPTGPTLRRLHSDQALSFDYGFSLEQVSLINVPAVHNMGNYGQGVIVGDFDNGFRLLEHEAFDSLRPRIIATYDFVDHKVSVVPDNPNPGFGAHGIVTLSTLAGFAPGNLIGPAFGAQFILARTENDSSETPIEEDNWVAAIEWADSVGVDVTSTSLGYLTYDPPYTSWTWQDMNGNTTLITRAADMAVSKGIVVVNSAGNNGLNTSHNTLNAPADGDSVITVGAATPQGTRAGFSSVGPTTSIPPHIKPDIMATGTTVRCASAIDPHQYQYQQGTSLSCPLAAGVAAMLLHAKPTATPVEVANALRNTASQASTPDNLMGWGIINALAAVRYISGDTLARPPTSGFHLMNAFPNPFPSPTNPSLTIQAYLPEQSLVTITIFNSLGQEVRTLLNNSEQASGASIDVRWNGISNQGRPVAGGVYYCRILGTGVSGRTYSDTKKVIVLR